MSSFSRREILGLLVLLTGCGFTPVYGPGGTGTALHGKIEVNELNSPYGYLLVRNLETRLGRASDPQYQLTTDLFVGSQGQAITESGAITRYSLVGKVDYWLRRTGSEDILVSGNVENFTGYSATGSTVETLASERDAAERLMAILANQISAELFSNPVLAP